MTGGGYVGTEFTDIVSPISRWAEADPDHPAIVFGEKVMSYEYLYTESRRVAVALQRKGVVKGDRIAVLSPNRPEVFSIYLGIALAGAAIVMINAEYARHEVNYILDHCNARMVICSDERHEWLVQLLAGLGAAPRLLGFDALFSSLKDIVPYTGPALGRGDDLVYLAYTSGTTSMPKGVAASHTNELASAFAYSGMWHLAPTDRVLVTLPVSFSYGFHVAAFVSFISGATIFLEPRFHPRLALEAIERLRPTVFLGVPTMYAMMADVARKDHHRYDVSSLRVAAASGAALSEQVIADCRDLLGLVVRPYYAMTEVRPIFSFDTSCCTHMPPAGSVGKLIPPTQARIVDESGRDLGAEETGELWVRGPSFSGAYYRDPERTAKAMTGGWFRTGDLASRDEAGNYFIVGRIRDQIVSGGAKIAPVEVENALLSHPGISAVAVVGSPDPVYGQIVKAVVVKSDTRVTVDDVKQHCAGLIAEYKIPRVVVFVESLPTSPSGKVLKSALV